MTAQKDICSHPQGQRIPFCISRSCSYTYRRNNNCMDQLCVSMYASMHSHCCACMFGPKQVHTYCTYIHTYIHYLLTIMAILLSSVADKNCLLHKSLLHNTRMLLIVLLSTNYIQNTVTSIHTYIHTYTHTHKHTHTYIHTCMTTHIRSTTAFISEVSTPSIKMSIDNVAVHTYIHTYIHIHTYIRMTDQPRHQDPA